MPLQRIPTLNIKCCDLATSPKLIEEPLTSEAMTQTIVNAIKLTTTTFKESNVENCQGTFETKQLDLFSYGSIFVPQTGHDAKQRRAHCERRALKFTLLRHSQVSNDVRAVSVVQFALCCVRYYK